MRHKGSNGNFISGGFFNGSFVKSSSFNGKVSAIYRGLERLSESLAGSQSKAASMRNTATADMRSVLKNQLEGTEEAAEIVKKSLEAALALVQEREYRIKCLGDFFMSQTTQEFGNSCASLEKAMDALKQALAAVKAVQGYQNHAIVQGSLPTGR